MTTGRWRRAARPRCANSSPHLRRPLTRVAQAKSAIDTSYGDAQHLNRAAPVLLKAMSAEPGNAAICVQAARLTIKGGPVVASQFQPGTVEAYIEPIDKALALDPAHQKAHILKAQVHDIRGSTTPSGSPTCGRARPMRRSRCSRRSCRWVPAKAPSSAVPTWRRWLSWPASRCAREALQTMNDSAALGRGS
ncbi:hypothetical protein KAK06_08470 [Ideonella sp. 4Y11]|uniref:Uncharacterized protein n=1 Tax=Ideonella aquatica TaxID=2824119 RepID=A0A941BIW9_9BURK|nr:hypothetical protein [Ideonella aquatica]MBQ0958992.1 hypothetical protein [Ideonella aquatica]